MLASDRISKTSINSLNIFIFITVYLTCISSLYIAFLLIIAVPIGAREGNDVADVFDSRDVHYHTLESEAEPGMHSATESS